MHSLSCELYIFIGKSYISIKLVKLQSAHSNICHTIFKGLCNQQYLEEYAISKQKGAVNYVPS